MVSVSPRTPAVLLDAPCNCFHRNVSAVNVAGFSGRTAARVHTPPSSKSDCRLDGMFCKQLPWDKPHHTDDTPVTQRVQGNSNSDRNRRSQRSAGLEPQIARTTLRQGRGAQVGAHKYHHRRHKESLRT